MERQFDVAIIGAGICGASLAYELSKYDLKICVLEKEIDVAMGTTKANSAIVHAGYDPKPGTKMARLNVRGSNLIREISKKLSVPYAEIGSLVLAFNEEEMQTVQKLYDRGVANGVEKLKVLNAEEVKEIEPNLQDNVVGALYAGTGAVVSPWELDIAMLETAVKNGCSVLRDSCVTSLKDNGDSWEIGINGEEDVLRATYVVNCAGIHADDVMELAGEKEFTIYPSKGEYFLLDKNQGDLVKHVCFQCPSRLGKGVLVSPTVGGNLIVGPDAQEDSIKDQVGTSADRLDFVVEAAGKTTGKISYRVNVRKFAGLRANSDREDFIIEAADSAKRFVNVAGIKSPGLSSAPAIAEDAVEILKELGLSLNEKENYVDSREKIVFHKLSPEDKAKLVASDPAYGRVICRCATITEGEILAAIHSPIPPKTLDGVKRRCGTGMGRCQGGFCGPKIHRILSRELGIPEEEICQEKTGSYILSSKIGEGEAAK